MTKAHAEDTERPPSRNRSAGANAAPSALIKDQAEGAQLTPSSAAAQAGRSIASVHPPYVADAAQEVAQRLPPQTAAGDGPSYVPTRHSYPRGLLEMSSANDIKEGTPDAERKGNWLCHIFHEKILN